MEINDIVTVTLKEAGAKKLNEIYRETQRMIPSENFKTDYIAGDQYTCPLWELFSQFGELCGHGHVVPFTNMQKE